MKEIHEQRGGLFGSGYVLSKIKVGWIPLDVPNGLALQEKYEGFTLGEIAAARKQTSDRCDARYFALAASLKSGFETEMIDDAARGR